MIRGFTCGTFDLFHPGHVLLLEWARTHCDYLLVGLQTNPTHDRPHDKEPPVQSMFERWIQLRAHRAVDEIVPYDTERDLENLLASLDLHVRFLGDDYATAKTFTGREICQSRGIQVMYAPRRHSYSSTELRRRLRLQA